MLNMIRYSKESFMTRSDTNLFNPMSAGIEQYTKNYTRKFQCEAMTLNKFDVQFNLLQ